MNESKGLLRSAGAVSLATLVSRILGLVREQVQAYVFGAGLATDAFWTAFRIPNLLRDLFAEGALSSAFVATFTAERTRKGEDAAWALARRTFSLLVVSLGAACGALFLAAPWIVKVYAPGFDPDKLALTVTMTRILAPFLLLVSLAALAMGILNTRGRFFLPALAPAWFNVMSILAMVALPPLLIARGAAPVLALAVGALAGGGMQFLVQVPALRKEGFRIRWDWAPRDPGLRRVGALMLPATFGLAAIQINIFVDTVLASGLGDGPISWLQYAFRLIQLPIGLFGVALGMANLARVSRDAARGDLPALRANLSAALRAVALLALPAAAGLIALRTPIVRILFERGRFGAEDTLQTAGAVLCYALGLYAYSATKIQVPTFYALGDTRIPVLAAAAAVASKIGTNFLFLALFPRLGLHPFLALATGTAAAAWVNFGILAWGMRRKAGSLAEHRVVRMTLGMALLSAAMAGVVAATHRGLELALPAPGVIPAVLRLAGAIAAGLAVIAAGVWASGGEEAELLRSLARRLGIRR
jgi:putative peptidoglycan lipid II flippase